MVADAASDTCLALIAGSDTSASVFAITDTCKPSLGCTDGTQGECVFTYTYEFTDTKPAGAYSMYVRLCPPGVDLPLDTYLAAGAYTRPLFSST